MILLAILAVLTLMFMFLISIRNKTGPLGKIVILIMCCAIGVYILTNIFLILYFFFGDFSTEESW